MIKIIISSIYFSAQFGGNYLLKVILAIGEPLEGIWNAQVR